MPTANPPSWEEWVNQFNAPKTAPSAAVANSPYAGIPGVPELFDPNFGRSEQIQAGAENAVAGGWGGGGFTQNQTNRLLDSERKANFLAGHQILEPYLQRDFTAGQNAAERQSRLNQIAAEGAQALQRLQLSEAGQTARLDKETQAALERAVLAGNQALQQITLREAGETGRTREQIGGNLAQTLLTAALRPPTTTTVSAGGFRPELGAGISREWSSPSAGGMGGTRPLDDVVHWGAPGRQQTDTIGTTSLGSTAIDALLRKYGLI